MAVTTSAGCKIYIGDTNSSPSPDTYQEIGEVENFSEFGRVYAEIKHKTLGSRAVTKFKGSYDDGTLTIKIARSTADVGQAAAIVARDADTDYNFKVTLNDAVTTIPTTFLFKAKVLSYTVDIGSADQVVGSTLALGIKSGSITETAAS